MGALIAYDPASRGSAALAKIVWSASQALLTAARQGESEIAERCRAWLHMLREDARCSPALARTIDGSLSAAARHLPRPAGTAPAE